MVALACVSLLCAAAETGQLKRSEELFAQYKWAEARSALAKARTAKGLTREQLLHILEMTGVAAAQQRQVEAAQTAFIELITLDPEHKLEADYAPKVMTPFLEAKRIVDERGALKVAVEPKYTAERVESLTVRVVSDPLKAARAVRFHVDATPSVVPLTGGAATALSGLPEAKWWAELLGDNETELFRIGSEAAPRVDRPPAPVVEAPPPPTPAPAEATAAPVVEQTGGAKKGGGVRMVSYVVFALALVSGGVGGYFGWQSGEAFSSIRGAMRDGAGRITSLTERQAYALEAQGSQGALIANSLYAGAGALAAIAVILWLVGG